MLKLESHRGFWCGLQGVTQTYVGWAAWQQI